MTCEECHGVMMDALYSEELGPQASFRFFKHLDGCAECRGEYLELLETREALSRWEIDAPVMEPEAASPPASRVVSFPRRGRVRWWSLLREVAAGVLILIGAASVLQGVGLWSGDRLTVSKRQLVEMINDIYVENSAEDRRIFGQALVNFADDLNQQRRTDQREINERLHFVEGQLLDQGEETNQYLKVLLAR